MSGTGSATVEFEIKAALDDAGLAELTRGYPFGPGVPNADEYFDTPDFALFRQGAFVRVRDGRQLEIKFNPDRADASHTSCLERCYPVPPSPAQAREILAVLAELAPSAAVLGPDARPVRAPYVVVRKVRRAYLGDDLAVFVDEVAGLGRFVEVEARGAAADAVMAWADRYRLAHIPVGYVELVLRTENFDLYRRGRYLLPDDV